MHTFKIEDKEPSWAMLTWLALLWVLGLTWTSLNGTMWWTPHNTPVYISSCLHLSGGLKCFWCRRKIPYWVTHFSFMFSQLWSCVKTPGADRGSLAAAPQRITAMETARNSVYDIWGASKEVSQTIFSPGHAHICKVSTIFCPRCHVCEIVQTPVLMREGLTSCELIIAKI